MKIKVLLIAVIACWFSGIGLNANAVQSDQLAPPNVSVVDRFGVNLATGQVTPSLSTVSIGGQLGLTHSITLSGNHFSGYHGYGYTDSYAGNAKHVYVGQNMKFDASGPLHPGSVFVMRVFGPVGGEDFWVNANSYTAIGDSRHTLIADGDYLVWTNPDGVESYYFRGTQRGMSDGGALTEVIYPNGFKVKISFGSVVSNTGYHLKYQYDTEVRPEIYPYLPPNPIGRNSEHWEKNPLSIVGINRAYEYCSEGAYDQCSLSGVWPTAYFNWPAGTPRAMYAGPSVFSVTDSLGGVTDFHYEAQDVCQLSNGSHATECDWDAGEALSPRLVKIKSSTSSVVDRTYQYVNQGHVADVGNALGVYTYWQLDDIVGRVVSASHLQQDPAYDASYSDPAQSLLNQGGDYYRYNGRGDQVDIDAEMPGKLIKVKLALKGVYDYEQTWRNFVTSYRPLSEPKRFYHYDDRGNLIRIVSDLSPSQIEPSNCNYANMCTFVEAEYPDTCANPKVCNKPIWTKDARGYQSDYTYHPESGQIETVAGPADSVGIRPKTTYEYSDLYAYYKKDSNAVVRADSPLWLLTKEFSCRTSNATETGCSGGNLDKAEKNYYYGPQNGTPNNLLLRGVSVTAEETGGNLATRVTCYAYDKYGNQISETLAKGTSDLTSCP